MKLSKRLRAANRTALFGYRKADVYKRQADIEAEPLLKNLVRVQCFDKVSGLWYDGADRLTECTQIYLSMLLACLLYTSSLANFQEQRD